MKKCIKWIVIVVLLLITLVLAINFYVKLSVRSMIIDSDEYDSLKDIDYIIVLGAGIRNKRPSPLLEDRLTKAIELYNKNESVKIIMSGDHIKADYNEVGVMKNYAIEKGVPEENIIMDHAGVSTYDTIYRAKNLFKAKKVVIVTQEYHLYRALYIAKKLGLESYGVSAEHNNYSGLFYWKMREVLARDKDFVKCIIKPESAYSGEIWNDN